MQKPPDATNPVSCALPIACSGELSLDGYLCTLPPWAVCKIVNLLPSPLLLISYILSVGISWCTVKVSCLSAMNIPRRCLILYECLVCHQGSLYECFQFIQRKCDNAIAPDGNRSQKTTTLIAPEHEYLFRLLVSCASMAPKLDQLSRTLREIKEQSNARPVKRGNSLSRARTKPQVFQHKQACTKNAMPSFLTGQRSPSRVQFQATPVLHVKLQAKWSTLMETMITMSKYPTFRFVLT